jgi:hypothetical protein
MRFALDKMSLFMRMVTTTCKFCQDCTKCNTLLAMAATKVCNYCDNPVFTNQDPGVHHVTLSGRVHHFFTRVSSSNPQSCGLSYFVFDSSASCSCLSESGNVDKKVLNVIANGLKSENPYCNDLHHLGISVQQGGLTVDANVVPRMVNQSPRMSMSVCAVMNCRQTGVMSLQVTTTNGSISDVKMNSEKVEGLCYPLLFPCGEPGCTNEMKDHISPAYYVMARMLMPKKVGRKYMTAPARYYSETQIIDSCTREPFASDEDDDQVDQHGMQLTTCQFLRVNWFILMFRLAQYWLLDIFSRICDQRLSIIVQMRDQIMMGQPR